MVQNQFKGVLDSNVLTPSLSHYVRCVMWLIAYIASAGLTIVPVSSMHGELGIIQRPLIIFIDSLITQCKTETVSSINMRC